jgi:anti-sigma regulatory factor (Ser/Thr protein kinase)
MEHSGFQHSALIYDGEAEYLAATVPFLEGALEAEEPALVAVRPHQTALLEDALGEDGKHVRFVNMHELGRNPAWIIPFWRDFVEECGGRSVRGIGEPVWSARSPAALEECQRHESLLNVAFAQEPSWSLLCPYDARSLGDSVLEEVAASHPMVARDGELRASECFDADRNCFAGALPPPRGPVLSLEFDVTGLSQVRGAASRAAEEVGFDVAGSADFVTAASELAANSVMHGGGSGTLRLWHEAGDLLAEVEDRGTIDQPLVGRMRPGLHQEGGRGLWIANQLCDLVQIRSGSTGTVVRMHAGRRQQALV